VTAIVLTTLKLVKHALFFIHYLSWSLSQQMFERREYDRTGDR